mmetsp:Transcript_3062/g.7174  ORF Transcript_3062/g.7174 Transcript_3062/m.7174 type:complete len:125 (+) Transcript_3062:411-785(+)
MNFGKFIEIGRIITVNYGPSRGKIAVIVDIIDKNRCLIDGPSGRQMINLKRVTPSKFKFSINRKSSTNKIHQLFLENKIEKKWFNSRWGKKVLRVKKKENFSDFENFKFMIGKKYKSNIFRCHI